MAGSFRKRGNKYELIVYDGYKPNGKQRRFTKTVAAKDDKEASRKLALFFAEIVNGNNETTIVESFTLAEFYPYWKENYAFRKPLANKTIERYDEIFFSRIEPALGNKKLSDIKESDINRFIGDLQKPGMRLDGKKKTLSPRVVEMHYRLLSVLFNKAIKWGKTRNNPCVNVDPPLVEYDEDAMDIYDTSELESFLKALDSDSDVKIKYKAMVHLALVTGCRRGEILGLNWKDVDFTAPAIYIHQASEYIVGKPIGTKSTKTKLKHWLYISKEAVELLHALQEEEEKQKSKLGTDWIDSGRVFTQRNGSPMHVNSYSTWITKFAQKHGIKRGGLQCLRHSSATHKLDQGVSVRSVQADLGHTRLTTTSRYVHKLQSANRDSAEKMSNFIQSLRESKEQKETN